VHSAEEWVAATGDSVVQREYARLQRVLRQIDPVFHRTVVRQRILFAEESEKDVAREAQIAVLLTPGCAQGRPLRALSVLGNDSKFFERHRAIVIPLLDARFDELVSDLGLETFLGAPEEGITGCLSCVWQLVCCRLINSEFGRPSCVRLLCQVHTSWSSRTNSVCTSCRGLPTLSPCWAQVSTWNG
jgi:hypothetical protein